jgi:uncharacterized protein (TIGR02186 family)
MSAPRPATLAAAVLVASLAPAMGPPAGAAGSLEPTIDPARAEIGLFHSGVDVIVSAETEPGVEVAVLATGPAQDLALRERARRWGVFWAPAGEVTFHDVPSLYLLRATADLEQLAPAHVLRELGIGYEALRPTVGAGVRDELFGELIALKESEGLFSQTIVVDGAGPAGRGFASELHIPARALACTYSIELWAFRDGRVVGRGDGTFGLERTRFVDVVSSLAETHGLEYGLVAVAVAVAAGLLVGSLFGSTRKKA